jgi:hypothetical protein
MTCPRDMIFNVLYGPHVSLPTFYVHQSMKRLKAPWQESNFEPDVSRALFFLLLDRDMVLKEAILKGIQEHGIEPFPARKAEMFFLSLREEVIEPWLCDERITTGQLIDKATSLYWAC